MNLKPISLAIGLISFTMSALKYKALKYKAYVASNIKGAPPGANQPVGDPTSGQDTYSSPLWWCSEPPWKSTNRLKISIFAQKGRSLT